MTDPILINAILLLGLIFKFVGFAVRDELWLRGLVAAGLACDALFYGLRPEPVLQSVATNGLLILINTILISLIIAERTTWKMSSSDREIYSYFSTLTPGQFRRLRKVMQTDALQPRSQLLKEGAAVSHLILILADQIEIEKEGKIFPIGGPAFVGEIALLTGRPSSASVSLPMGGIIIQLPIERLKRRMSRSPALSNAIVALFGLELARKVSDSTPMERAITRTLQTSRRGSH